MGLFLCLSNACLQFCTFLRLVIPKVDEAVLVAEKSRMKVNRCCAFCEVYLTMETPCRATMVDF